MKITIQGRSGVQTHLTSRHTEALDLLEKERDNLANAEESKVHTEQSLYAIKCSVEHAKKRVIFYEQLLSALPAATDASLEAEV